MWFPKQPFSAISEIIESFENNKYTLGVLIDVSQILTLHTTPFFSKYWNYIVYRTETHCVKSVQIRSYF